MTASLKRKVHSHAFLVYATQVSFGFRSLNVSTVNIVVTEVLSKSFEMFGKKILLHLLAI